MTSVCSGETARAVCYEFGWRGPAVNITDRFSREQPGGSTRCTCTTRTKCVFLKLIKSVIFSAVSHRGITFSFLQATNLIKTPRAFLIKQAWLAPACRLFWFLSYLPVRVMFWGQCPHVYNDLKTRLNQSRQRDKLKERCVTITIKGTL